MFGSLFGGWLGDQAESSQRLGKRGRPLVGQLSTLIAIPLIYTGLLIIPREPQYFSLYAANMFLLGFAISWCPSGVNRPILSEIVEVEARATIFAVQIAIEASVASCLGSPIITLMAETLFGFRGPVAGSVVTAIGRQRNIHALANALLVATAFPWTVCFFLYGFLYYTYPADAAAASKRQAEFDQQAEKADEGEEAEEEDEDVDEDQQAPLLLQKEDDDADNHEKSRQVARRSLDSVMKSKRRVESSGGSLAGSNSPALDFAEDRLAKPTRK
eukprot:GHVT01045047.1.p1 GENE.GHVT01045047.1~~GHVT01045047.1.p1  ORF type:complete len:273 (-),score=53.97 GHVT01045047.1:745-1563(-)